jgi:hypothetical protein
LYEEILSSNLTKVLAYYIVRSAITAYTYLAYLLAIFVSYNVYYRNISSTYTSGTSSVLILSNLLRLIFVLYEPVVYLVNPISTFRTSSYTLLTVYRPFRTSSYTLLTVYRPFRTSSYTLLTIYRPFRTSSYTLLTIYRPLGLRRIPCQLYVDPSGLRRIPYQPYVDLQDFVVYLVNCVLTFRTLYKTVCLDRKGFSY